MTENDEEQETDRRPARPNAFWAANRHDQEERAARLGFGADFRAVPQPRSGSQNVRADQTIGNYNYCWCGLPMDHDWPGKAHGRHHPQQYTQEELVAHAQAANTEAPHIVRSDLRGFGDNYTDLIIKAVNDYGTRYRLNNKGIILYPPDGTDPYSLPMRENTRTLKAARIWYARHIADLDAETKRAKAKPQTDEELIEAAKKLAARHNSPEHPVPPPAKKAVKKAAAKKTEPSPTPKEPDVAAATVEEVPTQPEWTKKYNLVTRPITPGWFPVRNHKGETNPFFEVEDQGKIKDTRVRCLVMLDDGEPCPWEGHNVRGTTGHMFTKHDPEGMERMYGDRAMKLKMANRSTTLTSRKEERIRREREAAVQGAISTLLDALEVEMPSTVEPVDITPFQQRIETLERENADLQARITLMREAFRDLG